MPCYIVCRKVETTDQTRLASALKEMKEVLSVSKDMEKAVEKAKIKIGKRKINLD